MEHTLPKDFPYAWASDWGEDGLPGGFSLHGLSMSDRKWHYSRMLAGKVT